ncbi:MAG: biotin--[acetyl-CoA-carboxylase] ligase [Pirellulales bacterium]
MSDASISARVLTETFVRTVESFDELPSTNDRAIELAGSEGHALPLLVHTTRQSAGRGRGEHRWWSETGALTFSLLLDAGEMKLEPRHWPLVSLAAAMAVRAAAADFVPSVSVGLKWPNDVFAAGRKLCGILVETLPSGSSGRPGRLVIGIGLNVNNSFEHAPSDLRGVGVSLAELVGSPLDLQAVLVRLLAHLRTEVTAIAEDPTGLAQRWHQHCLLRGHVVSIENGISPTTGRCHGVSEDGGLMLETAEGPRRVYGGTVASVE